MTKVNTFKKTIIDFWDEYLDFKIIPKEWENRVALHNHTSGISEDEFFITEFPSAGRHISVSEKYADKVRNFISEEKYDFNGLKKEAEMLMGGKIKQLWPVTTMALWTTEKIKAINSDIAKLGLNDKKIFEDFMDICTEDDKNEVNMEFDNPTHTFFVLRKNWTVVSLWNYSVDDKSRIGHLWILTPKKHSWNWYWKTLVNAMVIDILQRDLAPQYRAQSTNIASIKIAVSLWFETVLESFSFVKI